MLSMTGSMGDNSTIRLNDNSFETNIPTPPLMLFDNQVLKKNIKIEVLNHGKFH